MNRLLTLGATILLGTALVHAAPDWPQFQGIHRTRISTETGHLYVQSETNVVGLAEATPTAYVEKGRFEIPDKGRPSWAHPVVSDGRLYVRNQDTLLVYDIKAPASR